MSERLFKSTAVVSANTLGSRVLGLVRDVVIARYFGASVGIDAFLVAFRLPNLLRRMFAEGAFSQAFIPVLAHYRSERSDKEVRDLVAHVFGHLGGILFIVTLAGVLAAPVLVYAFAPGFLRETGKFELTVEMVRITFPYILFVSLTSFAGGLLNTYGRFGVPAFTPILLNVSLIACAIWLAPHCETPVTALAWGVLIAGIVQLGFQLPFLLRLGMLVRPRVGSAHEGVRRILRLMLPALFGTSVSQINLLINTFMASFLVTGSVTWLYYSDRMVEFPLGMVGVALATVVLPSLSAQHAKGETERFSGTLDWGLRLMLMLAAPSSLGLAILAGPVLATLFQYGEFTPHDVEMAHRSLAAYSLGLVGFASIKILAPGYFSRQDTATPVRIGVITVLTNIVLNLALIAPLQHAGLALATALSALLNAGLLLRGLLATRAYVPRPGWFLFAIRIGFANFVMAGFLLGLRDDLQDWIAWSLLDRVTHLGALIIGAALVYLLALLLTGMRPSRMLSPR